MKIASMREIPPTSSRCISVKCPTKLFRLKEGGVATHNSVVQRNIFFSALCRPHKWEIMGVDLKRTEFSFFKRQFNVPVAVETHEALKFLRFGDQVMMNRNKKLEELDLTHFTDEENHGPALLIIMDEATIAFEQSKGKSEEAKEEDEMKAEMIFIWGRIIRLGRSAGVHTITATQRPNAEIIPGEVKFNMSVRISAGKLPGAGAQMILDENANKANSPFMRNKGRLWIQSHGVGGYAQGFFENKEWLIDHMEKVKAKYGEGSGLDKSELEATDEENKESIQSGTWDDEMDDLISG